MKFARYKQLGMPSLFQHFSWTWMRPFIILFYRVKIVGQENVKSCRGNVIIASNHANELDPLFIVAALPFFSNKLPIAYVSRSKDFYTQMSRGFFYGGKFFELMGAYPVYPGLGDYEQSLQHHLGAIKHGRSVGIFPVGKRHSLSQVSQARGGVMYLAQKTGLPIIPMKIDDVSSVTYKNLLNFKNKMTITFGKPVYAQDLYSKTVTKKTMLSHHECEKAAIKLMKIIAKL